MPSLTLYHGTMNLEGDSIAIKSNTGVGWNHLTLGDAFYSTFSLEASLLFSHLVLQKAILSGKAREQNDGFAKVYTIALKEDINILHTEQPLDADAVRGVLLYAGVSKRYLNFRHDDQLTDFYQSADLLCYGHNWEGNRNEYLVKALGYDAIMTIERAWKSWEYYPVIQGLDWQAVEYFANPPRTLAIYQASKIAGFQLFRSGYEISQEQTSKLGMDALAR